MDKVLWKKGEVFLASAICEDSSPCGMVSGPISKSLAKYEDVMPLKLSKELPFGRVVDHRIDLVLSVVPPSQPPYRISLRELVELRRQLDKSIDVGFIHPFKALYGAPILF